MYPIPPHEHLVETRTCKHCQTPFPITDKDMEFYAKVSPKFGEKTYMIPPPTLCPDCRQQRRLSFRNERKLYKRKCDATGKDIISIYSPDKPYTVYHQDYWWSDEWDPIDYGREFDFSRSAMEQFQQLLEVVPIMSLMVMNNENSEYVNYSGNVSNSYLIFASSQNKNALYCRWVMNSENIVDSNNCSECFSVFECIDCVHCTSLEYCIGCVDCTECYGSYDLTGCHHCIGCSLLRNQSYCINNIQYSKEDFSKKKDEILIDKKLLQETIQQGIHRSKYILLSEDVRGEYIVSSSKVYEGYDIEKTENCKYVSNTLELQDTYDLDFQAFHCNLNYDSIGIENANRILFTFGGLNCKNITYSNICFSCSNCFLCVGLRNKQYCILNKQYTKEEYEILVPRIIEHMMKTGEWGEFFPSSMSPFGYNETVAQEYYPMTREEILGNTPLGGGDARRAEGVVSEISEAKPPVSPLTVGSSKDTFLHGPVFNYSDYEPPFPKVEKIIPANKLPDDISKIPDDILNWAIECEVTKKPFRIIPQELAFYRKHNIPIPRRHPDQRHLDRMAQRNPRKLYERLCDCPNCEENAKKSGSYREKEFDFRDPETRSRGLRRKMITTYAPERPETVYCEVCYEREV